MRSAYAYPYESPYWYLDEWLHFPRRPAGGYYEDFTHPFTSEGNSRGTTNSSRAERYASSSRPDQ